MSFIDTETLTLDELDTLTLDGVDSSLCVNEGYTGNPSGKRLFRNRLFAGRLFAPALWRGLGEEVEVQYYPPQSCLSRHRVRIERIQRLDAATKGLRRIHVATEELDSNG